MKTLKITLLLALFVVVSSQTEVAPSENAIQVEVNNHDTKNQHYDLLAHSKDRILLPTQG